MEEFWPNRMAKPSDEAVAFAQLFSNPWAGFTWEDARRGFGMAPQGGQPDYPIGYEIANTAVQLEEEND